MDTREEYERYREWLKHPVTKDMMQRCQKIAEDAKGKYDNCTEDELRRLQLIRRLILVDLPQMLEKSVNPPKSPRWDWRHFLGL